MEVPVKSSPLGMVQCEAGCQLEKKVDVLLTGCVPGNQGREGQEGVCQFVIFTVFVKFKCLAISKDTFEDYFLHLF